MRRAQHYGLPRMSAVDQAGNYLSGIGLCVALSRRWPRATARWDHALVIEGVSSDDVVDYLLDVARSQSWQAPTERSHHPIFGRWGRREPDRWQPVVRSALAELSHPQQELELRWVLGLDDQPIRLSRLPSGRRGAVPEVTRFQHGLGTMFPRSVPVPAVTHRGMVLSMWQSCLAWESWEWLRRSTVSMQDYAWSWRSDEPPHKGWCAAVWRNPVELRRVRQLWSPRGRFSGQLWSRWPLSGHSRQLDEFGRVSLAHHYLRHSSAGAFSAEAFPWKGPLYGAA